MTDTENSLAVVTRQQAVQIAQMAELVQRFTTIVVQLDQRMAKIEKLLDRKVTISSKQYKVIQKAVKERAKALCDKHRLDQKEAGKAIRKAITSDIMTRYGVSDLHDLQDNYFDLAMSEINGFTSFTLIRDLRTRED